MAGFAYDTVVKILITNSVTVPGVEAPPSKLLHVDAVALQVWSRGWFSGTRSIKVEIKKARYDPVEATNLQEDYSI